MQQPFHSPRDSGPPQPPWYYQKWAVISLLVLFFPAGLYLLWRSPLMRLRGRLIGTALVALIVAAVMSGGGGEPVGAPDLTTPAPAAAAQVGSQTGPGTPESAASRPETPTALTVHYIDVGQGDATLLQGPDFTILIDAGRHDRTDVIAYLKQAGVTTFDLVIGTHPHADHIGQMAWKSVV